MSMYVQQICREIAGLPVALRDIDPAMTQDVISSLCQLISVKNGIGGFPEKDS